MRRLFSAIANRLPGAELLFQSTSPYALRRQRRAALSVISTRRSGGGSRLAARSSMGPSLRIPRRVGLRRSASIPLAVGPLRRGLPWVGRQLRAMKITHVRFRGPTKSP